MAFGPQAAAAAVLVILSLLVQTAGMAWLIYWARTHLARAASTFSPVRSAALLLRFASATIVLHLSQILLWTVFYRWNCFPAWEPAFYFSTANYSTVGAGDLVPPPIWRTLGPVESITGVLMCGLSASMLFALVLRLVERAPRLPLQLPPQSSGPARSRAIQ